MSKRYNRVLQCLELCHLGLEFFQLANSFLHGHQTLLQHHKLVFKHFPDRFSVHDPPLHKFLGLVITGLGTGCFKPLQVLFQDLACIDRVMLHKVDFDLDLVHIVYHLLLHNCLVHLPSSVQRAFDNC